MKLPKPSLARFFGGPPGAHALLGRHEWPLAAPFAFGMLTLNWVVLMLRQVPCMRGENRYTSMCYTDLVALFQTRDWANDSVSFISNQLEYPVLTGVLIDALRKVQQWLTPVGAQDAAASDIFFGVNAVVLFALLLVMVGAHLRLSRPGDAMLIACSPAILTAGLINWDALAMALVALGLLAWARRHPLLAGALIGLGAAAKLYPLLLLVPLVVLCLRANRLNECALAVGGAILAWLAVNAPVYFLNSASWLYFWTFNEGRGADLGSLWYLLQLVGYPVADPSRMETILMVVGTLVICALLLFAPRRPRLAQGVFLIVAWFLVVNKVYSPQYVLWLLPLLALARPRWLDWAVFSISETCYFAAIWLYLNDLTIDNAGSYPYYWFAIMLRIAVQLWLCAKVVYDIFHPEADVVRAHGRDDPDGGALDWAADANWVRGIAPVAPQPTTYR